MASIKVLLKEEKVNSKGEAPLYLRIIKERSSKYISLKLRIAPRHWDEAKEKVKKGHVNSAHLNNLLAQKIADAHRTVMEQEAKNKDISNHKLKQEIMGTAGISLFRLFERHIDEIESRGEISTCKKYKVTLAKLKEFTEGKDILMKAITTDWLKEFERYLSVKYQNGTNTIHTNLKLIKKIFNLAVKEELISYSDNPFLRYKLRTESSEIEYLKDEELEAIEAVKLEEGSRIWQHRELFILASYAGGIRISDLLQMKWKNFDGERFSFSIHKTKSTLTVKIPERGLRAIEALKTEKTDPENFLFPFLNKAKTGSKAELLQAISSNTAYVNKNLRIIANKVEIEDTATGIKRSLDKPLHFHVSRHTWATRALRMGMRIEYVSKLLGHKSIKTTQIYAKIVDTELEKAMEIFNVPSSLKHPLLNH